MGLATEEACPIFKWLFDMGVQPEALLLPRRPDQGKCKLCQPEPLQALVDVLIERCNGNLSPHKEVIMRCYYHSLLLPLARPCKAFKGRAFN